MATSTNGRYCSRHTLLIVIVIVLAFLFGVFLLKYIRANFRWYSYTVESQQRIFQSPILNAKEEAMLIGKTIVTVPASNNQLFRQSKALESYAQLVTTQTDRDVVIVDTNKTILADTVGTNVGTKFLEDKGGEVAQTLLDGNVRTFLEQSVDYPQGISQIVVPIKGDSNITLGAVILSSDHLHSD